MVYMGVMVDVRIVTDIKNQKEQNNIIFNLLNYSLHTYGIAKEFCIAECKNMLVFFTLGVFAFENGFIHKFLKDYSINKVIFAIVAFVVCEYLYFSDLNSDVLKTTLNILLLHRNILCN